jgi:integrase
MRLCEVTAKRVQAWLDAKGVPVAEVKGADGEIISPAKKGASWSTRNDLRNLLSGIFERAIAWKYWQDANPIQHVTAGRKRLVRQKIKLTDDQTRRLLAKLPGQVRIVAQVALFTGLRISEVLALKEKSIEFETGQIYVQERFHRGDLDITKNRAAERRVPMGYLADDLRKLCMGDPRPVRVQYRDDDGPTRQGPQGLYLPQ